MRWGWSAVIVCAIGALSFRAVFADDRVRSFPRSIDHVLRDWEDRSKGLLGVGSMEVRRLYELHGAEYSAHEIAVLGEFRGPVEAAELNTRFDWSIKRAKNPLVIAGRPTDALERMFFEEVTVTFDSQTRLPKSVQFRSPHRKRLRDVLAVVPGPRISEPNRFQPAENARPLTFASNQTPSEHVRNPVRVIEHVTLMPVPESPLPAEVQRILDACKTSADRIDSLKATIDRRIYELGQGVEHRAVGTLTYRRPETVQCDFRPVRLTANEASTRKSLSGVPFELLPSPAEHWEYTPAEIRYFKDPEAKPIVLRRDDRNAGIVRVASKADGPLRGLSFQSTMIPPWGILFSASLDEMMERFEVRLNRQLEPPAIEFFPKRLDDAGGFQRMRVQFDQETGLPGVVEFLNWQGDVHAVYAFRYQQIENRTKINAAPKLLPARNEPARLLPALNSGNGKR